MQKDKTILTLDAGGTNFVFSAIRNFQEVSETITLPANAHQLDECLGSLVKGFKMARKQAGDAAAISFAFPGPADYKQGIIGDLPNFPAFTDPVPLADILEEEFRIPVYINNDANLFAAGEAEKGFLPALNKRLAEYGSNRTFRNLIGITLGTGFGCGFVINENMLTGDNSSGAEIHNTLNKFHPSWNAEEDVSTRGIIRFYEHFAGNSISRLTPKLVYEIAHGRCDGDQKAALQAFERFGESLGASLGNVMTLIDGVVVLGGGLTGAWDLFSGAMFSELDRKFEDASGKVHPRLSFKVFDLQNENTFRQFSSGDPVNVRLPGSAVSRTYDAMPRTGIGLSSLGVSRATMYGAYSFALRMLNEK